MPVELGSRSEQIPPNAVEEYVDTLTAKWDTLQPKQVPHPELTTLDVRVQATRWSEDVLDSLVLIGGLTLLALVMPTITLLVWYWVKFLFSLSGTVPTGRELIPWKLGALLGFLPVLMWSMDRFMTHWICWLLANPNIAEEARHRRRRWWDKRWNPVWLLGVAAPTAAVSSARIWHYVRTNMGPVAEMLGMPSAARWGWRQCRDLWDLSQYPLTLFALFLVIFVPLLETENSSTAVLKMQLILLAGISMWHVAPFMIAGVIGVSLLSETSPFSQWIAEVAQIIVRNLYGDQATSQQFATVHSWLFWGAVAVCVSNIRGFRNPLKVIRATWNAIIVWLCYGVYGGTAAGVLRSPAGSPIWRLSQWALLTVGLSFLYVPSLWHGEWVTTFLESGAAFFADQGADAPTRIMPFLTNVVIPAVATALIVPVALLSACFTVCGRIGSWWYDAVEAPRATDRLPQGYYSGLAPAPTPWDTFVTRLQRSQHPEERDSIFFGFHLTEQYPVLVPRSVLNEHVHITGDSGSGKTALGLIPMLVQLVRAEDSPMVIIDLKGDRALFQTMRREAGERFKHFTIMVDRSTYLFNPFTDLMAQEMSVNQLCEIFLSSLGLEHGLGYGRSYFSRIARDWLTERLEQGEIRSFEELLEIAQDPAQFKSDKHHNDAYELVSVIRTLARMTQLNVVAETTEEHQAAQAAIHMPEVIEKNQVVYFYLPAAREPAAAREIGSIAVYSFLAASQQRMEDTGVAKRGYLVIDEFQRMASKSFEIFLQQARSMGLGAILSHQTISDLKTPDHDLTPVVQANTRLKQSFSASDLRQQEAIMQASGETSYRDVTVTQGQTRSEGEEGEERESQSFSISTRVRVGKRMSQNDIINASDDPFTSIVHLTRSAGLLHWGGYPNAVRHMFAMSKEEYEERQQLPWPELEPETVMPEGRPTKAPLSVASDEEDVPFIDPDTEYIDGMDVQDEAPIKEAVLVEDDPQEEEIEEVTVVERKEPSTPNASSLLHAALEQARERQQVDRQARKKKG